MFWYGVLERALVASALAQEKAAPAAQPVSPAPGPAPSPIGGLGNLLFPLALCFVVFYLLVILPERKKQKSRQAMIRNVQKGDQVVTTAGILGKVTRVEEHEVVLQVDRDNDVRIRFQKSAIHDVIPEATQAKDAGAPSKEGAQ